VNLLKTLFGLLKGSENEMSETKETTTPVIARAVLENHGFDYMLEDEETYIEDGVVNKIDDLKKYRSQWGSTIALGLIEENFKILKRDVKEYEEVIQFDRLKRIRNREFIDPITSAGIQSKVEMCLESAFDRIKEMQTNLLDLWELVEEWQNEEVKNVKIISVEEDHING
tara:strand:+ start:2586 stop:3095 length:510 start_codon:yes stop_codon:yes gene_type:complete